MTTYAGLTWDHPRGKHALVAAGVRERDSGSGLDVRWETQPLEGFESRPIPELAERYDMIVLDHPHLGEAIAGDALIPLDTLVSTKLLDDWERDSVGPSFGSYQLDGHQWALPLDAATQVAAYKPSAIDTPPGTWDEVEGLSKRAPVALSLAGPHALLTFASLCVALGEPLDPTTPELLGEDIASHAFTLLRAIGGRVPSETLTMNPIALLTHMRDSDRVTYCPLVYGYVNYSSPTLKFADAPRATRDPDARPGSTIGGTGLALTRRCKPTPELLAHVEWLMSDDAQRHFIPDHDGQPSRRDAWHDEALNARTADFYRATVDTIESSWVRPRNRGYIAFQTCGSRIVRDVIAGHLEPKTGLEKLRRLARGTAQAAATAETAPPTMAKQGA
jgi:multiple sugar transport system substrate-binding protein